MLLKVPESIENPMWEGVLEEARDTSQIPPIKLVQPSSSISDKLPRVSIGHPEKWKLIELYESGKIPVSIQTKLNEANFYLVRLSCSFRPIKNEFAISQALFIVELLPDKARNQPIAFDLHPLEVYQEVKQNFKVTINPTLKFEKVEGSLGNTQFGIEYSKLQPVIIANGVLERRPSWEYQKTQGQALQGSKIMHLLLKVPKTMQRVRAKISLTAEIEEKGIKLGKFNLWNKTENEATDYLSVQLM